MRISTISGTVSFLTDGLRLFATPAPRKAVPRELTTCGREFGLALSGRYVPRKTYFRLARAGAPYILFVSYDSACCSHVTSHEDGTARICYLPGTHSSTSACGLWVVWFRVEIGPQGHLSFYGLLYNAARITPRVLSRGEMLVSLVAAV